MHKQILTKLGIAVLSLLIVSVAVFFMLRLTKGDPVDLVVSPLAPKEVREAARIQLGLDKPLIDQYAIFLKRAVVLDFGKSVRTNQPVVQMIKQRLGNTLELGLASFVLSLLIGVPLGLFTAIKKNTFWDKAGMTASSLFMAIPSFWAGLMLILIFSLAVSWLPPSGAGSFRQLILPVIALSFEGIAVFSRMSRASFIEILNSDFVLGMKSRGVNYKKILFKHVLKNGILPIISLGGLRLGFVIAGAVIVEVVFAWPGIGRLLVDSIVTRDYPVVQGVVLLMALIVILVNILADYIYLLVDPRIRY
ncbi:MAG: ABC transporter permease [Actinobacteria bacterium]|nr:ABC transporter permease [Actinomycetota bacterium]